MPIEYLIISELLKGVMEAHPEEKEKLWMEVLRARAFYEGLVREIPIPQVRAIMFHEETDRLIRKEIQDGIGKQIRCKIGCSHCCRLPCSVTKDEAQLLIGYTMKYHDKGNGECRFLENDLCAIYENRPASCRKHFSIDRPYRCRKEDGVKGVYKLIIIEAEALWSGAINVVGSVLIKNL